MGDFVSVSVSIGYACAATASGRVDCWGDNSVGELGDTTTKDTNNPKTIAGL
jgi:alpha-tubulin suppressor-like RCC1 family protein